VVFLGFEKNAHPDQYEIEVICLCAALPEYVVRVRESFSFNAVNIIKNFF
jgi:hypothetical protein